MPPGPPHVATGEVKIEEDGVSDAHADRCIQVDSESSVETSIFFVPSRTSGEALSVI